MKYFLQHPLNKVVVNPLMSHPKIYDLWQDLAGMQSCRQELVRTYIRPRSGEVILDIGCGTARIFEHLPDVEYLGIDVDPVYIAAAQKRYGKCGASFQSMNNVFCFRSPGSFDLSISMGVLHHLSDEEAVALFSMVHSALKNEGRFITYDETVFTRGSGLLRFFLSLDRGPYIRTPEGYRRLATQVFSDVQLNIRTDLTRLGFTHAILECRKTKRLS